MNIQKIFVFFLCFFAGFSSYAPLLIFPSILYSVFSLFCHEVLQQIFFLIYMSDPLSSKFISSSLDIV